MKKIITKKIVMICKYATIGLTINCLFLSLLFASNTNAQGASVDDKNLSDDAAGVNKIEETSVLADTDVTGKVTDAEGMGLPGVNILIEGSTNGTISDIDGNYKLSVPEGSVIVFSYIGYLSQKVSFNGQSTLDLVLEEDAQQLDEIIVTGYSTRTKGELTGAITTVNTDYLEQIPSANVTQALQGSAAGVTVIGDPRPGFNAQVRIRGVGTINNNNPLYVIDGVNAGSLPPTDQIQSIQILKDAASTAIYGARGANGVIIITTKRGSKGQGVKIDFTVRTGIKRSAAEYDLLTDPLKIGELKWLEQYNDGVAVPSHQQFEYTGGGRGELPGVALRPYVYPITPIGTDVDHSTYNSVSNPITMVNQQGTNWLDEIVRDAVTENYALNITGGSENTTYGFNGSYLKDEGVLLHTSYNRAAFRSNIDSKLNDWLRIGQTVGVRREEFNGNQNPDLGQIPLGQVIQMSPLFPVRDINGEFAGPGRNGSLTPLGEGANPVAILERDKRQKAIVLNATGTFYAEIAPLKGLTLKSLYGYSVNSRYDHVPAFAAPDDTYNNNTNSLQERRSLNTTWNWSNTIKYATTFNDVHAIEVLLGTEANESKFGQLTAGRSNYGYTDEDFYVINAGDGSTATNGGTNDAGYRLNSYFGSLHYAYMGKYMLDVTARRDGSSRFGVNERWGTFPAVSLGWTMSEEGFMSGVNAIQFLKLRGSWGQSGNDQIGNYNSYSYFAAGGGTSYYAIDGSNDTPTFGYQSAFSGNPDGKWETTTSTNIALETSFLNHFDMTFDFWQKNTDDMLYPKEVPGVFGRNQYPDVNIGSMENKGVDISMDYHGAAMGGDLKIDVSTTFTHYKTKITKMAGDSTDVLIGANFGRGEAYTRAEVGQPFPSYYGYVTNGIFQDIEETDEYPTNNLGYANEPGHYRIVDVNGDGVIDENDRDYIGNPHPDFTTGLILKVAYKGIDLSASLYASVGNEIINWYSRNTKFGLSNGASSPDRLYKSWGSPYLNGKNENATLPRISGTDDWATTSSNNTYVEDGSYLRLQNVQLGYNFSQPVLDRLGVSKMRLYVMGANLFTITGYSGLNPEIIQRNATSGINFGRPDPINRGVDTGAWPMPRTFMIGLNMTL